MTLSPVAPPVAPDSVEETAIVAAQNGPATQNDTVSSTNGTPSANGKTNARRNAQRSRDPQPNELQSAWQVVLLPVDEIAPCPYQPRLLFDPAEMEELTASVKAHGVQQPVLVRPAKSGVTQANTPTNALAKSPSKGKANDTGQLQAPGKANGTAPSSTTLLPYELVAGERRLRASKGAGRKYIPAIVRPDLTDAQAAEIALSENVQRSNLSSIEEARGYKQLMLKFRMSEERISKKVGKSVATIQHTMKLLALPEGVQTLLAGRKLTAAHGHSLLPLAKHERICLLVAQHVIANSVTATSLSSAPLPNVQELKRKKLVQELGFGTKFEWREVCKTCPFHAYVPSGYSFYCLLPAEWYKKQSAAVEQQKSESARALQEAREQVREQEASGGVDIAQLPANSFRDLSYGQVPQGCSEACTCRRESPNPRDASKTIQVCLDPARLKALQDAERQAHEEARKRRYMSLWQRATAMLQGEVESEGLRKLPALLVGLVLHSGFRYGSGESWETLARGVAHELGVVLPWEAMFESRDEADLLEALETALAGRDVDDVAANAASSVTEPVEASRLLLFAGALLLASEAKDAVRWAGDTPRLDFVLGPEASQGELVMNETDEAENAASSDNHASSILDGDEEDEENAEDESENLDEENFDEEKDDEEDLEEERANGSSPGELDEEEESNDENALNDDSLNTESLNDKAFDEATDQA